MHVLTPSLICKLYAQTSSSTNVFSSNSARTDFNKPVVPADPQVRIQVWVQTTTGFVGYHLAPLITWYRVPTWHVFEWWPVLSIFCKYMYMYEYYDTKLVLWSCCILCCKLFESHIIFNSQRSHSALALTVRETLPNDAPCVIPATDNNFIELLIVTRADGGAQRHVNVAVTLCTCVCIYIYIHWFETSSVAHQATCDMSACFRTATLSDAPWTGTGRSFSCTPFSTWRVTSTCSTPACTSSASSLQHFTCIAVQHDELMHRSLCATIHFGERTHATCKWIYRMCIVTRTVFCVQFTCYKRM